MANFTTIYNEYVRANLPLGMTYSGDRYRYNNKSFPTFLRAYWYYFYLKKLGSGIDYRIGDVEPFFVADFAESSYAKTSS